MDGQDVGYYATHQGVPAGTTVLDGESLFTWAFETPGWHKVAFVVDVHNNIAESDETTTPPRSRSIASPSRTRWADPGTRHAPVRPRDAFSRRSGEASGASGRGWPGWLHRARVAGRSVAPSVESDRRYRRAGQSSPGAPVTEPDEVEEDELATRRCRTIRHAHAHAHAHRHRHRHRHRHHPRHRHRHRHPGAYRAAARGLPSRCLGQLQGAIVAGRLAERPAAPHDLWVVGAGSSSRSPTMRRAQGVAPLRQAVWSVLRRSVQTGL